MEGDKPIKMRVTDDGSPTLFCSEIEECYHSMYGARTESEYIFIRHGFDKVDKPRVRVFEVGMGTGLNLLLTMKLRSNKDIVYHAIEKYPVPMNLVNNLKQNLQPEEQDMMSLIHGSLWETDVNLASHIVMRKMKGDMTEVDLSKQCYDVIYFDAFSPEKQPEMWTADIFKTCYDILDEGGILVTYCSKGIVKRALRDVGFDVKRHVGPPGKRHIVVAVKQFLYKNI